VVFVVVAVLMVAVAVDPYKVGNVSQATPQCIFLPSWRAGIGRLAADVSLGIVAVCAMTLNI
jgi:hypothetical protein